MVNSLRGGRPAQVSRYCMKPQISFGEAPSSFTCSILNSEAFAELFVLRTSSMGAVSGKPSDGANGFGGTPVAAPNLASVSACSVDATYGTTGSTPERYCHTRPSPEHRRGPFGLPWGNPPSAVRLSTGGLFGSAGNIGGCQSFPLVTPTEGGLMLCHFALRRLLRFRGCPRSPRVPPLTAFHGRCSATI